MVRGSSQKAIDAGGATVFIGGDTKQLQQALRSTEMYMQSWGQRIQKLGRTMMAAGIAGAALFIKPIREAATVEQLLGRFDAVFGEFSKSAGEYADQLAKKINQSGLTVRDQMAQFNAYLKGIGFDPTEANAISRTLTEWANDWIAFDDTIVNGQEAVDLFLSALSGEVRPARRMGADLRVLALDALAMSKGLGKASKDLTEVQRVRLRMESMGKALGRSGVIGQAQREVKTLAAEFRGFKGAMRDMTVAVGMAIIKPFTDILRKMKEMVLAFKQFVELNPDVVAAFAKTSLAVAGLGTAFLLLGKAMTAFRVAALFKSLIAFGTFLAANPIVSTLVGIGSAIATIGTIAAVKATPVTNYGKAWARTKEILAETLESMKLIRDAGGGWGLQAEAGFLGLKQAIFEAAKELKGFNEYADFLLTWSGRFYDKMMEIVNGLKEWNRQMDVLGYNQDEWVKKIREHAKEEENREEAIRLGVAARLAEEDRKHLERQARENLPLAQLTKMWQELPQEKKMEHYALMAWNDMVRIYGKVQNIMTKDLPELWKKAAIDFKEAQAEWELLVRAFTVWGPLNAPSRRQFKRPYYMVQDFINRLPGELYDMSKPWFAWIEKNQLKFFGRPTRVPELADFRAQVGLGAIGGTLQALQVKSQLDIDKEQLEQQKKIREAIERTNDWLENNKGIPTARG